MSAFHVYKLAVHRHEHRTLFRILARFLWPMVNKEVSQFIRACVYWQLVNSCSHEAQQLLQTIESDTPFDVVFLDSGEPGDIPNQYVPRKILTFLDCMTGFGIVEDTGMKKLHQTRPHDGLLEPSLFHLIFPKLLLWMQMYFSLECSTIHSKRPF